MQENLVKTYVISKGWRIAAIVAGIIYISLGVFFILVPYLKPFPDTLGRTILFSVLGVIFVLFSSNIPVLAFKFRFEVWTNRIRCVGIFGIKEMRLEDITGYRCSRIGNGNILYFVSDKSKRMTRTFLGFENLNEFKEWVETNFKNLTTIEAEKEMAEALSDENLGTTEEQRKGNLKKRKRWISFLIFLVFGFCFWGFSHPQPYEIFICGSVLLPFFGVGLLFLFPKIYKLNVGTQSPFAPGEFFVMTPIPILAYRAFNDWNILDWNSFWIPFVLFTISLFGILLALSKDFRKNKFYVGLWLIFCALYGYGACIGLNGILDKNNSTKFSLKVVDKQSHSGKTTYFMTLPPFGPVADKREYTVYRYLYEHRSIGDPVTVSLKNGAFHIPYYYIY